jgi:hypothetical protein
LLLVAAAGVTAVVGLGDYCQVRPPYPQQITPLLLVLAVQAASVVREGVYPKVILELTLLFFL